MAASPSSAPCRCCWMGAANRWPSCRPCRWSRCASPMSRTRWPGSMAKASGRGPGGCRPTVPGTATRRRAMARCSRRTIPSSGKRSRWCGAWRLRRPRCSRCRTRVAGATACDRGVLPGCSGLELRAQGPQFREQHHIQHLAQVADAAGAAGAALEADDAFHRRYMAEAPEPEGVFQVHQLLAHLVEIPVRLRVAVDGQPGLFDALVGATGLGPVAL
mmetsp:Transcript_670/g.1490  ORF Transcript_670/g.1490 Transcript_670/m.1490 type:complete len:217 (+) Transcript_670:452-1102(+)